MNRRPSALTLTVQYVILILAAVFAFYPVWFAILASGRLGDQLYSMSLPAMFVPPNWTFENYRAMLFDQPLLTWLRNSLYVASVTTVASLIVTTSAAFALSRFRFYGRELFLIFLLAIQTFPGI